MADLLPQSIWETQETGTITYANQKALESFGYSADDLNWRLTVFDMIAPEERDRLTSEIMSVLHGTEMRSNGTEYRALRKDGRLFVTSGGA